jgi:hypothetical protein
MLHLCKNKYTNKNCRRLTIRFDYIIHVTGVCINYKYDPDNVNINA